MRRAINNPTERILRLLAEVEDLNYYADMMAKTVMDHLPELLVDLPPKPTLLEYHLEMQRQVGNYRKPLGERKAEIQRRASERWRLRGGSARDVGERDHEETVKLAASLGVEVPDVAIVRRTELTVEESVANIKRQERNQQMAALRKLQGKPVEWPEGFDGNADKAAEKLKGLKADDLF